MVRYMYRLYNGGRVGWFVCDVEDFRNLWRYLDKSMVVWCCCSVGGVGWFWSSRRGWFKCGMEFVDRL